MIKSYLKVSAEISINYIKKYTDIPKNQNTCRQFNLLKKLLQNLLLVESI